MRGLLILLATILCCGNPQIVRYFALPGQTGNVRAAISEKLLIYDKDGLKIRVKLAGPQEVLHAASTGKIDNTEFRIPSLTYLQFYVENLSESPLKLNFFRCLLLDESGKDYPVISREEFQKLYTSVAYQHFHYSSIFAFYTFDNDRQKPGIPSYVQRFDPGSDAEILPGQSGIQIVPLPMIPESARSYRLRFQPDHESFVEAPLTYRVVRADQAEMNPETPKKPPGP